MSLEKELATELRKTRLRTAILATVEAAGVIAIAAVAPNALSMIGKVQKKWSVNNARSAIRRLIDRGFIEYIDGNLRLTKDGERYLASCNLNIDRPPRWDGKWRVIIFDIPEKRAHLRSKLRHALCEIGFVRLQNSVWAFPYDCEELVMLLKAEYQVGKEVLYMIVDRLENDRPTRSHFGL